MQHKDRTLLEDAFYADPVLDKSEGAVRTLLYRTIQTLRDIYASADKGGRINQGKGEK